jgi:hypothetical protein
MARDSFKSGCMESPWDAACGGAGACVRNARLSVGVAQQFYALRPVDRPFPTAARHTGPG